MSARPTDTRPAEGVWEIYLTRPGARSLLDGESTDDKQAMRLYRAAFRAAPSGTLVELVDPQGTVVMASMA